MSTLSLQPDYRCAAILAVVLTLLNAAKPAVIDDTAHLYAAAHIAQHPGDPYGYEFFWYAYPEPAMAIVMPPVVPYWLALGITLFGEQLFLLKLWLFPFAAILCFSSAWLIARFAPGLERTGLILLILSPAILVLFNFFLDIPALSLGVAAIRFFISGCERKQIGQVIVAGLLAGLAMQTKFSFLMIPMVLLGYALLHRCWREAIMAVSLAGAIFWLWECYIIKQYGTSHFLFHTRAYNPASQTVAERIDIRVKLFQGLIGQLGGLMFAVGAWILAAFRPRLAVVMLILGVLAVAPLLFLPHSQWPYAEKIFAVFALIVAGIMICLVSVSFPQDHSRDTLFLLGWLLLEGIGAIMLSPFPAARRVLGICFVLTLLGIRIVAISGIPRFGSLVASVLYSLSLFALDVWDAQPEKQLANQAANWIQANQSATAVNREIKDGQPVANSVRNIWFSGHWGFQYYCSHAGMKAVVPQKTALQPGDWLVYPEYPDTKGIYRPYHGGAWFAIDPACAEQVSLLTWDDWLQAQTIPNLYGTRVPVENRDHPRLKVGIYKVLKPWTP